MIEHVYSILSSRVLLDRGSNNLTIVDAIEQLNLADEPKVPEGSQGPAIVSFPLTLTSLWWRDPGTTGEIARALISIVAPDGKEVGQSTMEFDLEGYRRNRTRINFPGVPFHGFGVYRFVIRLVPHNGRKKKVASVPLEIVRAETLTQGVVQH